MNANYTILALLCRKRVNGMDEANGNDQMHCCWHQVGEAMQLA